MVGEPQKSSVLQSHKGGIKNENLEKHLELVCVLADRKKR